MPRCGMVDAASRTEATAQVPMIVCPQVVVTKGPCGIRRNTAAESSLRRFFEKANQAGDGAGLIGNNFLKRALLFGPNIRRREAQRPGGGAGRICRSGEGHPQECQQA